MFLSGRFTSNRGDISPGSRKEYMDYNETPTKGFIMTNALATNLKGAAIGFGIVAAPVAALVLGQEISYRIQTRKTNKLASKVQAFVNAVNQIQN